VKYVEVGPFVNPLPITFNGHNKKLIARPACSALLYTKKAQVLLIVLKEGRMGKW